MKAFSFSEPYIEPKEIKPVEIEITFIGKDPFCYLSLNATSLDNWNNTLEVTFSNEKEDQNITFQISKNKILGQNDISVYYEENRIEKLLRKGEFRYNSYQSLGKYNNFTLKSFEGQTLNFEGYYIELFLLFNNENCYVSKPGSKIILRYEHGGGDSLPPLYLDADTKVPLNNCYPIITTTSVSNHPLLCCEVTQENLDYIENYNAIVFYYRLCGAKIQTDIKIKKLDVKQYPVLEVTKFIKPKTELITIQTDLVLISNNIGNTKIDTDKENFFIVILEIEDNGKNTSMPANCSLEIKYGNTESYITCHIISNAQYQYQNIYLLPYNIMDKFKIPFEVIINEAIKAEDEPEPRKRRRKGERKRRRK